MISLNRNHLIYILLIIKPLYIKTIINIKTWYLQISRIFYTLSSNNPQSLYPMKKKLYPERILVLILIISVFFACRKSANPIVQSQQQAQSTQSIPYPQSPVMDCSYSPNYGDSIIYAQPVTDSNDYIVSPINNPGPGTFMAWPSGLAINSATGAIDVTKSDAGERFDIGFVKNGTTDTCIRSLIIAGVSYMDSVYVLADNESQVYPYYDANPYSAFVCGWGASGNSGSCQFDVTGSAKNLKVFVDPNNGWIDLQKTLDSGAFGLLPYDGEEISPVIYYQLNDASNMAIQHIQVNILYYDSKSQINASLLNNLNSKLNNILLNTLIMSSGNPRPPMIIITRFN
jgi:hypothetical protein